MTQKAAVLLQIPNKYNLKKCNYGLSNNQNIQFSIGSIRGSIVFRDGRHHRLS
jgi:hypothetical protein